MIDLHSHLIWNIDDGSNSKEMTINMLRQAVKSGTRKLVLTPHYLPGYYAEPICKVKERSREVEALLKEEKINLEVYVGQEVYFTTSILENLDEGIIGTINNSRYMLIEFNMKNFSVKEVTETLYELQLKGIVPIIAHPERYHIFIKNPSLINEFINEGYLFQLNSGSLTGDFGKDVKKLAENYINNKIYSFIGSDAHRDEKRNTDMSKGIELLEDMDKEYFRYIKNSGEKLLENEEVKFIGNKIKVKKGFFSLFSKK